MKKYTAHRTGEGKYLYRGWKIIYNDDIKKWLPISTDNECDWSCDTLREAKQDIDNYIERI